MPELTWSLKSVGLEEEVGVRSDGSIEDEGALRLADVVPADGFLAEFGQKMRTVVDLQRLTLSLKFIINIKSKSLHSTKTFFDLLICSVVKDVAKISTNKLSTFDFQISTFISHHVSTLYRVVFRRFCNFYLFNHFFTSEIWSRIVHSGSQRLGVGDPRNTKIHNLATHLSKTD